MAAVAASSLGLKAANASQALLERTQFTGSFDASERAAVSRGSAARKLVQLRAQQQQQDEPQMQSRRSMFGLVATSVAAGILAVEEARAASSIKITGPPPPSGGLPGTENADQPRDLDLPLKQRSFIQPLSPTEAVSRVKEASKDIIGVKDLIAKKSWPYVRNDLRNKATYLRYDLSTIISAKPKDERKELKLLYTKLFDTMDKLDYAARMKDPAAAEKGYSETVAALDDVIAKL